MGIRSSKDILVLPKGVNKIIEEYCSYTRVFEKELLGITTLICDDGNVNWCYSYYFISCRMKFVRLRSCIKKENGTWRVCSYD